MVAGRLCLRLHTFKTEMCFVTLLERDLLIQYLHAKTFLHEAFDKIFKVVDTFLKKILKDKTIVAKDCNCGVSYIQPTN